MSVPNAAKSELYPIIYALYPECNISIHVLWGLHKQNTVFTVGKSIFNRTSKTNIGELMYQYGGGGHANAGTCQIEHEQADEVLRELIKKINADG
jgi:nanoRNase/pAp phosphatase (c-di-AMP/oligoRNAs hydrolase)